MPQVLTEYKEKGNPHLDRCLEYRQMDEWYRTRWEPLAGY